MNLPDPAVMRTPFERARVRGSEHRNGNRPLVVSVPESMYRAIHSLAELESKSIRVKALEMLKAQLGHEFYEETTDWESEVDWPLRSRIERWKKDNAGTS